MIPQKTYKYCVDWATVSGKQAKLTWHNDPSKSGTFLCQEDVASLKIEVTKQLRTYTSSSIVWKEAYFEELLPDENGNYQARQTEIEVSGFAPCTGQPNGDMVRVRASEDWSSWQQNIQNFSNP